MANLAFAYIVIKVQAHSIWIAIFSWHRAPASITSTGRMKEISVCDVLLSVRASVHSPGSNRIRLGCTDKNGALWSLWIHSTYTARANRHHWGNCNWMAIVVNLARLVFANSCIFTHKLLPVKAWPIRALSSFLVLQWWRWWGEIKCSDFSCSFWPINSESSKPNLT